MPPKAHRAGATGLPRTHSRSSSGGSSKAALNLHFTQKDPAPAKQAERTKKNGFVHDVRHINVCPSKNLAEPQDFFYLAAFKKYFAFSSSSE
jgi:hypothetical protein